MSEPESKPQEMTTEQLKALARFLLEKDDDEITRDEPKHFITRSSDNYPVAVDPKTQLCNGDQVRLREAYFTRFPEENEVQQGRTYHILNLFVHDRTQPHTGAYAVLEPSRKRIGTSWLERIVDEQ